jgi:uncharacterized membrane protein YvbJ
MNLKGNIFSQPEGYKTNLKQAVFNKINHQNKTQKNWSHWVIAASIALLMGIGIFNFHKNTSNNQADKELIFSYLEQNIDDIDEDLLYTFVEVSPDTGKITVDEILFDEDFNDNEFY